MEAAVVGCEADIVAVRRRRPGALLSAMEHRTEISDRYLAAGRSVRVGAVVVGGVGGGGRGECGMWTGGRW